MELEIEPEMELAFFSQNGLQMFSSDLVPIRPLWSKNKWNTSSSFSIFSSLSATSEKCLQMLCKSHRIGELIGLIKVFNLLLDFSSSSIQQWNVTIARAMVGSLQQAAGTAILPLTVCIDEIVTVEYNGFFLMIVIKINKKLCTWACLCCAAQVSSTSVRMESDKWSPFITVFQQCRLQAEVLEECLCEDQACARLHLTLLFWKVLSRNGVLLGKKGGTWKQCRKCQLWGEKCSHTEGDAVICFFLGMEFHEELHNLGTKEGLKGRKLSKAIESFAWNITVLKVSTENTLPCASY